MQIEQAQVTVEAMKLSLEKKDSQLNATKTHIEQLRADLQDASNAKKEKERLMKELQKLKKVIIMSNSYEKIVLTLLGATKRFAEKS